MSHDDKTSPSSAPGPEPGNRGRFGLIQFVVAYLILLGLNVLLAPEDVGWKGLNPSPWLVVPFYIGIRFGFFSGVLSAIVIIGTVITGYCLTVDSRPFQYLVKEGPYFLWAFLIAGVMGAFIRKIYDRRIADTVEQWHRSREGGEGMADKLAVLQQNEADLKRALVAEGIEMVGIADSLRQLFATTAPERLNERFLRVLDVHCGVLSSAMYEVTTRGTLQKVIAHRDSDVFPNEIDLAAYPMCAAAVEKGELVTQQRLWEEIQAPGGPEENFLAVIPYWPFGKPVSRVLVIHRMEFDAISWEGFWRIETAFGWFENRCRDAAVEGNEDIDLTQVMGTRLFRQHLVQSARVGELVGITSRVIVFSPDDNATEEELREFTGALLDIKGRFDALGVIPVEGVYVFSLLVPLGDDEAAEEYANKLLEQLPDMDLDFGILKVDEELFSFLDLSWEGGDE